jgi:hypothetical protein
MEEPPAGGRSLPLPVRGRSLREGAGGQQGSERRRTLVVSAVRDDGYREILAVEVADTQRELRATYQELFRSLKARGLKVVELVKSDDHEGLKSAIERHLSGGFLAALPTTLHEESSRDCGFRRA